MIAKIFICAIIFQVALSRPQDDDEGRIVGGATTSIYNVPYQVAVLSSTLCGGTLIAKNVVVSAAHCTYGKNVSDFTVRAGSDSYNYGGVVLSVSQIVNHPQYNKQNYDYDISILRLTSEFEINNVIQYIYLASRERQNDEIVYVSGWGRTDPNRQGSTSNQVKILDVPFIDTQKCREDSLYGDGITDRMVCAGYLYDDGTKEIGDSCQGDSGGPLVNDGELVAVVSWGYGCASAGYPGVYTNIYYFRYWIDSEVQYLGPAY